MQTQTYSFTPNTHGQFAAIRVDGLTHYEAALKAQEIANATGAWVNASFIMSDGCEWPDSRIGQDGLVMPCKR